jgi:hypothetical protein
MPIVPDWDALRRPLRSCAIGAVPLLMFLTFWQFAVPGDNSNPVAALAFILAGSVCLSSGVGLAMSATRRLWRSTRRRWSALPVVFLAGVVFGFPSVASLLEAHWLIWLGSLLLALLVSAALSAYLIVTANDRVPIPSPPANFNSDDPDAYVSDIPGDRKKR